MQHEGRIITEPWGAPQQVLLSAGRAIDHSPLDLPCGGRLPHGPQNGALALSIHTPL